MTDNTSILTVQLPGKLKQDLSELAKSRGMSSSAFIRFMIIDTLKKENENRNLCP